MDRDLNPYRPGSGLRPRVMGGRREEIDAFDLLTAQTKQGMIGRGMMLHGLRGVVKTVLLNYLRAHAERHGWLTVMIEGRTGDAGRKRFISQLSRDIFLEVRRREGGLVSQRLRDAMGTVRSFSASVGASGVGVSLELDSERGRSGDLGEDLEETLEDVTEGVAEDGSALCLFIDEMQELDQDVLGALISAQHRLGQRELPFYIIGAGLPNLPTRLSEARSYAERIFDYRTIGPLSSDDAQYALRKPAEMMGASFMPEALTTMVDAAGRYPYFIQVFGNALWETARSKDFDAADAAVAIDLGWDRLDSGFFASRWGRATPAERDYLKAMAADGDEGSASGDVARRLHRHSRSIAPYRASLISKGLIYAPEYGKVAFTVSGMSSYIQRLNDGIGE